MLPVARYFGIMLAANLVWEVLQLPLYSLWRVATPGTIAFAVLHCTAGDVLIAAGALGGSWLVTGRPPLRCLLPARTMLVVVAGGLLYTGFSEWWSTQVTQAWTYAAAMPLLPGIGIGVAPMLQWLLLPSLALWYAFGRPGAGAAAASR